MADTIKTGHFAAWKQPRNGSQVYTEDSLKKIGRHVWKNGKADSDGGMRMLFSDLGINWRKAWFVDTIKNWSGCRKAYVKVRGATLQINVEYGKDWSYIWVTKLS